MVILWKKSPILFDTFSAAEAKASSSFWNLAFSSVILIVLWVQNLMWMQFNCNLWRKEGFPKTRANVWPVRSQMLSFLVQKRSSLKYTVTDSYYCLLFQFHSKFPTDWTCRIPARWFFVLHDYFRMFQSSALSFLIKLWNWVGCHFRASDSSVAGWVILLCIQTPWFDRGKTFFIAAKGKD